MTEKEKMLNGLEYDVANLELKNMREKTRELCYLIDTINPKEKEKINKLFYKLIPNIKGNFTIHKGFKCDYGVNIHLGENFYANYNLTILDSAKVVIGDNVLIGPNCSLITPIHPLDVNLRNKGVEFAKPIVIGNNVWIAEGVTIMPGVTIGDNTVIGAKSLVTKDIPSNVLAFGNPCKVQKNL